MTTDLQFVPGTFFGLSSPEIELLRKILCGLSGEAVEIGSMDGFSAAHILAFSDLNLTCIDPFVPDSMVPTLRGDVGRFYENVFPWIGRVILVRDYSDVVAPNWLWQLDFLFLDGNHRYEAVLTDFYDWTPFLKRGAVLAMHDARRYRALDDSRASHHPGPSLVAEQLVCGRPDRWEIIGEADSLTMARKLNP